MILIICWGEYERRKSTVLLFISIFVEAIDRERGGREEIE